MLVLLILVPVCVYLTEHIIHHICFLRKFKHNSNVAITHKAPLTFIMRS